MKRMTRLYTVNIFSEFINMHSLHTLIMYFYIYIRAIHVKTMVSITVAMEPVHVNLAVLEFIVQLVMQVS